MGVYIYGIKSPKHVAKVRLEDGTVMSVAKFAYAYKPYFSMWEPEPRWQRLAKGRLVRMQNIWREFISNGGSWPQGGVMVHGDENTNVVGHTVMTWPKYNELPTDFEDCTCNNATFVGKVAEVLS
jgi:hypothetical protein